MQEKTAVGITLVTLTLHSRNGAWHRTLDSVPLGDGGNGHVGEGVAEEAL